MPSLPRRVYGDRWRLWILRQVLVGGTTVCQGCLTAGGVWWCWWPPPLPFLLSWWRPGHKLPRAWAIWIQSIGEHALSWRNGKPRNKWVCCGVALERQAGEPGTLQVQGGEGRPKALPKRGGRISGDLKRILGRGFPANFSYLLEFTRLLYT